MLPHLPMLYQMTADAMANRRDAQREGRRQGTAHVMDIVSRESGELVGTTGFRSVKDGVAEFGIIVSRPWQRLGVCREAFVANAVFAWDVLGCRAVAAATSEANEAMHVFCDKAGMRLADRRRDDAGFEWWAYEAPIEAINWAALARTPSSGSSCAPLVP